MSPIDDHTRRWMQQSDQTISLSHASNDPTMLHSPSRFFDPVDEAIGRKRGAYVITLGRITDQCDKLIPNLFRFHSFRNHFQSKVVRKIHRGADDRHVLSVGHHPHYK